jgi:hypothetical protein
MPPGQGDTCEAPACLIDELKALRELADAAVLGSPKSAAASSQKAEIHSPGATNEQRRKPVPPQGNRNSNSLTLRMEQGKHSQTRSPRLAIGPDDSMRQDSHLWLGSGDDASPSRSTNIQYGGTSAWNSGVFDVRNSEGASSSDCATPPYDAVSRHGSCNTTSAPSTPTQSVIAHSQMSSFSMLQSPSAKGSGSDSPRPFSPVASLKSLLLGRWQSDPCLQPARADTATRAAKNPPSMRKSSPLRSIMWSRRALDPITTQQSSPMISPTPSWHRLRSTRSPALTSTTSRQSDSPHLHPEDTFDHIRRLFSSSSSSLPGSPERSFHNSSFLRRDSGRRSSISGTCVREGVPMCASVCLCVPFTVAVCAFAVAVFVFLCL